MMASLVRATAHAIDHCLCIVERWLPSFERHPINRTVTMVVVRLYKLSQRIRSK